MQKVVIHRPGGYDELRFEDQPDPVPAPGELLVDVEVIGVNYADCCVRFGVYSSGKKYVGWPITPGFEFAGRVIGVGAGATTARIREVVFGVTRFGAYATKICVPSNQVYPLPTEFTMEQAAAFPTVFLTAYHALFQCVRLRPGMTVLIHSAAGGVGSALVQLAKLAECRTIGVVGSSHKVEYVRALGCDDVIDKSVDRLWPAVKALAPDGVDITCDANGPTTLRESYRHLRPTGRLLVYGFHSMLPQRGGRISWLKGLWGLATMPRFNPFTMVSENRGVIGFNLSYLFDRMDLMREGLDALLAWANAGRLKPLPVQVFPLHRVADAHRAIESGQTVGKLVLSTRVDTAGRSLEPKI
jgi:NADPH:quinone reductase-like Zn-dependent oxidoreductase